MYRIQRPPLAETFELPSREELLRVGPDDFVKLIFVDQDGHNAERMWVKVERAGQDEWVGRLDSVPFNRERMGVMLGEKVSFHPLDVIDFIDMSERGS